MCFAYLHKYDKGTDMWLQVNKNDGEIYSIYWCETCDIVMDKHRELVIDSVNNNYPEGCVRNVLIYQLNRKRVHKLGFDYFTTDPKEILKILDNLPIMEALAQ